MLKYQFAIKVVWQYTFIREISKQHEITIAALKNLNYVCPKHQSKHGGSPKDPDLKRSTNQE